jgi:hypothetical protein
MYDCFRVEQKHVARLQQTVAHEIDLGRFEYFVEAYRVREVIRAARRVFCLLSQGLRRVKPKTPS